MAMVFQCDSCEKVGTRGGEVKTTTDKAIPASVKELCAPCYDKVLKVTEPKPDGRTPRARE